MNLKFLRTHIKVIGPDGRTFWVKRPHKLAPPALQSVGDCLVCHHPLMVAPGQQIRFHRECRKEGRRKFGRADHTVEVDPPKKVIQ